MIVQCPSCASRYRVNDANVPASGGKITCPSCQHKFIVYPEEQNPAPSGGGTDDLEDKTSVAFRPDLNKLVNQMQGGGGQQGAAQGGDDGVAATEVMSGDSIPDFVNGAGVPDDGTVEMKNPFDGGNLPGMGGQGPQDAGMEDAAPTEVVSGDMLDNLGFDNPAGSPGQQPPQQPKPPQTPSQQPQQSKPAQPPSPTGPAMGNHAQQASAPSQPPQPGGGGAQASFDQADGPAGPDANHDGPWKLKTNFGLTYEFPDTKSLKNWLSSREDLDGYELSGDGDNFHPLSAWPQISAGPAQSGPQQPPSFQANNPSAPPQQPPSGPGAGAAGLPSNNSLSSQGPPPSSPSSEPPGKKIKPQEYRPPSRDGKWNVLLWGIVLVLLLVAGGMSVQMFGIYDIKGELLGMKSEEPKEQPKEPEPEQKEAKAVDEEPQEEEPEEEGGLDPKLAKEVNRLVEDAERAIKNNRLQSAAEKLQNAKLLDPKRIEVYEMLAKVYAKMGQEKEAEAAKQKVAELQASQDSGDEAGQEASNK